MEDSQLSKYVVDSVSTRVVSREVLATSPEHAEEIHLDGVIVHTEVSGESVQGVHLA